MSTSLVQKQDGSSTSATSLVVTLGATPLAGNTLVVAVALNSGFVTSISGGGVTWTAAVIRSGSHIPTEIWSGVVTGTPADKGGLRAGDAIIAVDGNSIDGSLSLVAQVRERSVGDKVTLKIVRDGQSKDISVTLITKPTTNQ